MAERDSNLPVPVDARPDLVTWMFGLDKPGLMERPQPFGILPTVRFWNRIDTAKYQAPALLVGAGIMTIMLLGFLPVLVPLFGKAIAMLMIVPLCLIPGMLPLGLFEVWLRRRIEERRALGPGASP